MRAKESWNARDWLNTTAPSTRASASARIDAVKNVTMDCVFIMKKRHYYTIVRWDFDIMFDVDTDGGFNGDIEHNGKLLLRGGESGEHFR